MDVREIARRRMHGQHLWGPPLERLEDVVQWLGALQAQEFAVAKWSVAQRAAGVDAAAMDTAFADGAILRTHLLRPTWHFVLPADIRWILEVTAPRVHALNAYGHRQLALDGTVLARSTRLIARALEGETHLARRELAAMLEGSGIDAGGPRLAHILMYAELQGLICSGPPHGKQHTYALLDERAPNAITLDQVQVGGDRFPAYARTATAEEKLRLWALMASIWPEYDRYKAKTDREIPVVILERPTHRHVA
jgi:deazaflavin-dependent oxidoreductase (nitroreductase family)